jgi:uncharacterized membrane protein YeaQ/YmgE (transglycosylase-associated protein family)
MEGVISLGIIGWIVIGGFAGWLASKIMGADASMGLIANIAVGIVGAFIGGFVFSIFGGAGITGFNLYSFFVAVIGASILIFVVKSIKK